MSQEQEKNFSNTNDRIQNAKSMANVNKFMILKIGS